MNRVATKVFIFLAVIFPCVCSAEDIGELMRQAATSDAPVNGQVTGWLEKRVLAATKARGGVFATLNVASVMPAPANACKRIRILLDIKEIQVKDGRFVDYRQPFEVAWCPRDASFKAPLFVPKRQGI